MPFIRFELIFEVRHPGVPDDTEKKRIRESAIATEQAGYRSISEFLDEQDKDDVTGIEMVVYTLRGIGLSVGRNFKFIFQGDRTITRLEIPFEFFRGGQDEDIALIESQRAIHGLAYSIFENLDYGLMIFDDDGNIRQVSTALQEKLELPSKDLNALPGLIKAKFFEDLIFGPMGVRNIKKFENYRTSVGTYQSQETWMFNVSGYLDAQGQIVTLWQPVSKIDQDNRLNDGSLFENLSLQSIIEPYVPNLVLEMARDSIRQGKEHLPDVSREATVLFLDMVEFTTVSEKMEPHKVIDLLNQAFESVVQTIRRYMGNIDKFLGDGVMAVFNEPLSAVLAGAEIQNHLYEINQFREASGQWPIRARIGIHTGPVILGSIGTRERMDWTALGDTVNAAARIERQSAAGALLISDATYAQVSDHVQIHDSLQKKVKGRQRPMGLHFVQSVRLADGEKLRTLELPSASQGRES